MTKGTHMEVKDEAVSSKADVTEQQSKSGPACKDSQKGKKKRNGRQSRDEDSSLDLQRAAMTPSDLSSSRENVDFGGTDTHPKSRNTPSHKRNTNYSKRITEYFQISDTTKNKDDGDDKNPTTTYIDSTLLDEALDAEDIAKTQSDLQDIDILSFSQTYGLQRHVSADEDDERKRKRRKCSRLQDTIMKLISKAKQDIEHLDDKIRTLEAQYFAQPADATGLIKGWDSNMLGNVNYNSNSSKMRKGVPPKTKQVVSRAQALITEHIFSLTNSTCAVSRTIINKQEQ